MRRSSKPISHLAAPVPPAHISGKAPVRAMRDPAKRVSNILTRPLDPHQDGPRTILTIIPGIILENPHILLILGLTSPTPQLTMATRTNTRGMMTDQEEIHTSPHRPPRYPRPHPPSIGPGKNLLRQLRPNRLRLLRSIRPSRQENRSMIILSSI